MQNNRILLLIGGRTYRAQSFVQAAEKLGLEVIKGIDLPKDLAEFYNPTLPLQFRNAEESAQQVIAYAKKNPVRAVISVDDDATVIAALAADELDLTSNSPDAAYAAKNKALMRERLAREQVQQPEYAVFSIQSDPVEIAAQVAYPCVIKPTLLSASQGVIRANDAQEFIDAWNTTKEIVITHQPVIASEAKQSPSSNLGIASSQKPLLAMTRGDILVEEYIPGIEVALEGILSGGQLKLLALFDKPDPLEGPYFEETIYVTPSRLPQETQEKIFDTAARACAAISLRDGPIHAELRVNDAGAFVIEVAGRSIGGLCSKTLRFGDGSVSLEEIILRHAIGEDVEKIAREDRASGVMMIPIPESGLLKKVEGVEAAQAVAGIEEIIITLSPNHPITKLPYGNQYLGFIFARAETPEEVETALRAAHRKLKIEIAPQIKLLATESH
ncbi:MAG: ATP-grasp domain-containing protein [Chloroflexi bacterium]|nr:ATP-grasp domain-containing protein [Chloroflexota bacterium]